MRNLREEFDFSQSQNAANNRPRYRTLTQDTTQLEYEGSALGALGYASANVYQMDQKRVESGSFGSAQVKTVGANFGFDTPIFDKHSVKYGVNWRNQKTKPAMRTAANTVDEKKDDTGLYVEGIWNLAPITLTTGLRYDYFNVRYNNGKNISDGNLNPSLGVIYQVNPSLSLNGSLNYATRSPRLSEAALNGGRIYSADEHLKAERSRNVEVGFKYRWNNSLNVDGNYFWQNIKDVQAIKNNRYYNGGSLKNTGYEFNGQYYWRGLAARAGVAYNKPKMNGTNLDSVMTAVPVGRTWTAGLAYQFDNPHVEIGWRGRFVQGSNYDTNVNRRGAVTTTQVKRVGYGVNDVYLNWKPTGKDNLNVNLAVNNIGNKYYKPHSQRESGNGNSLPEVGRDFRLGVNYQF